MIRTKKLQIDNNRTSGQVRTPVTYESEISTITALDDSIEPEVMRGVNFVQKKNNENDGQHARKKSVQILMLPR